MRKLRTDNDALKSENAALKQEKSETKSRVEQTIQALQNQMSTALTMAVNQKLTLENELQQSQKRNMELEEQLSALMEGSDQQQSD